MKKALFFGTVLILAVIMGACSSKQKEQKTTESVTPGIMKDSLHIHPYYAKGFKVKYIENGVRLVDIHDPQDEESLDYHFALVPQEAKETDIPDQYIRVNVPIKQCICMTALQLSNFTALNAHDFVTGITGTKNLYNKDILSRVKEGKIVKIGMEGNFDSEVIMAANPDVIFISPFKRGGYEVIKETGITMIPHLGYKELDPLGQAEWIKFIGMFIGKETEANSVFNGIAQRYNDLKEKVAKVKHRPLVFSGEMHGGNWYAVGGKSYLARMFEDAGADYVMKDNPSSGGVNIDFEKMYSMAANADYWRILNSFKGDFSYEILKKSNERNADFKAFKEKQVIYCNMQQTPYYEITPVEPDVLLADLTYIFHSELMPENYKPTFYTLLK
ncbi:MAG: ABC transporter substrate-binding protein [Phocaeicola sp.]|uniref:ABC transporter substrate-binding protein n=1 Tax=Phocaeicola sp. TaxID=2773926 RepID=UPI003F9F7484